VSQDNCEPSHQHSEYATHKDAVTCQTCRAHERALSSHIRASDEHGARVSKSQRDVIGNNGTGGSSVGKARMPDIFEVDDTALIFCAF
jgi:hypothetical protein